MSDRASKEMEQRIVDNVAKHGCFIMSVFDPEAKDPAFSYSIGFAETVQQPEVIVFSLPKDLRVSLINELWRQMSDDGQCLTDGTRISGLLEGHDCIAREIDDADEIAEHFGSGIWYNRTVLGRELDRAFQIVWPGASQGLFPWDEGCALEVIEDQPALYGARSVH